MEIKIPSTLSVLNKKRTLKQVKKKKKKKNGRFFKRLVDYLKYDCYMYAPIISSPQKKKKKKINNNSPSTSKEHRGEVDLTKASGERLAKGREGKKQVQRQAGRVLRGDNHSIQDEQQTDVMGGQDYLAHRETVKHVVHHKTGIEASNPGHDLDRIKLSMVANKVIDS